MLSTGFPQGQGVGVRTSPSRWVQAAQYKVVRQNDSTVRQVFRTPARDTEIEGAPVREGQKIMLMLGAANRDPERWGESADQFDITRNAGGHMSFGRGIHQCVGSPIARLEADVLLSTFARRVTTIVPAGVSVPMLNNSLRGWFSLPVTITAA